MKSETIGTSTLYNCDCLELLKTLPDKSIDLVICDPPYGITACSWDKVLPFEKMWLNINRVAKENACISIFGSEPFSSYLRMSNIKNFKYDWIWYKNTTSGFATAKYRPLKNHEIISVFYKKQPVYNIIKEPRDMNNRSVKRMDYNFNSTCGKTEIYGKLKKVKGAVGNPKLSYAKSVQRFDTVPNACNRVHPTQKPVALLEYFIRTYTNENDVVLDFTMGSGTTGVACINTNRKFIGIEINKEYFDIACNRVREADRQQLLFREAV